MDITDFLRRVVPAGNFIAVLHNPAGKPQFGTRFFSESDDPALRNREAAGFANWSARMGGNTYFALASFRMAHADGADARGRPKYKGERSRANAVRLKSFWLDFDVKREGDGKLPGTVFPDRASTLVWLKGFCAASAIPLPNLIVNSGYGYHTYWTLETPLTVLEWQPYAEALKAAIAKHGFTGDAMVVADAARILRVPGSFNVKDATAPMPVAVMERATRPDYANQVLLAALQPYVAMQVASTAQATTTVMSGSAAALAGGTVSPLFGAQPVNMAAAAQANLPVRRQYAFADIALRCKQVGQSLATHGNGDPYPLWYLGNLSLAHHCSDGATYAHEVSKGDPKYVAADVDAAMARIAAEKAKKDTGPPRCATFAAGRAGGCQGCPMQGRIASPWSLGAADGDLPDGYRRGVGRIERYVDDVKDPYWTELLPGDVYLPLLDLVPPAVFALSFVYERAGRKFQMRVTSDAIPSDTTAAYKVFNGQGFTIGRRNAPFLGDFLMSWINKLRDARALRLDPVPPFGWVRDGAGTHLGLAVGGTLYRPDGSEEPAPGGDPKLIAHYTPRGSASKWQAAAAFALPGRVDMQCLVATAFGAPLMKLTGQNGAVMSAYSQQSGVGKSTALTLAHTVWAQMAGIATTKDKPLQVQAKAAGTQVMPIYWDEMRIGKEDLAQMVEFVFTLAQGKERGRLNSDSSMREVREWDTMLVCTSNRSLIDIVTGATENTLAGAMRIFEFDMTIQMPPNDPMAAVRIAEAEANYGTVGRDYARWLTSHYAEVVAGLARISASINNEVQAEQSERLLVTVMACTIAGAVFANKAGLMQFDIKGMYAFLHKSFLMMRRDRQKNLVVGRTGYDVEQVLAMFVADTSPYRMTTSRFTRQGPSGDFKVLWGPPSQQRVDMQVAQREQVMRIRRDVFSDWCKRKDFALTEMLRQLERQFGAQVTKAVVAGGTPWSGGQISVIDIPLVSPELAVYLDAIQPAHPLPVSKTAPQAAGPYKI